MGYDIEGQRASKTILPNDLADLSIMVLSLFNTMEEAGKIKLSFSRGTSELSLEAAKKNGKLSDLIATAASIVCKMKDSNILYRLNKRMYQVKQASKVNFESELIIRCRNSSLSWTEAYNRFIAQHIDLSKNKKKSVASIQYAQERVGNETIISCKDIAVDLDSSSKGAFIEALLSNFPIMQVSRSKTSVLIDFKELLLHEDAFLKLLSSVVEAESDLDNNEVRYYGPRRKTGRKALHEKYPQSVEIVTNFIRQHSFSAHGRRETTGTGAGVTLQAIREHVIREIPDSGDVSRQTLHHLYIYNYGSTLGLQIYVAKSALSRQLSLCRQNGVDLTINMAFMPVWSNFDLRKATDMISYAFHCICSDPCHIV